MSLASTAYVGFVSLPVSHAKGSRLNAKTVRHGMAAPGGVSADAEIQNIAFDNLKKDLDNEEVWTDGFTNTAFSSDINYVDPLLPAMGPFASKLKLTGYLRSMKMLCDESTLKVATKHVELVPGDFNPFDGMPFPPRFSSVLPQREPASFAAAFRWEITGDGRIQLESIIQQKPFVISGYTVVRYNQDGQAIRIESAWDQDIVNFAAYFNPLAHVPAVAEHFQGWLPPKAGTFEDNDV